MLKLLRNGKAAGVVIHKIDRSARNLKDWADLGELIDQGIEVHFANESLDLNSRGGRLSADIQAVVASDYIRNLREDLKKLPELIEKTHTRLERVQIECLPYEEVLKRFDRPATLFYLDPPYFARKLYRYNFTTEDFEKFEERLRNLRGKFVLSLNDTPEVRALFGDYVIQDIELSYSAQKHAGRKYGEVLITNFETDLGKEAT